MSDVFKLLKGRLCVLFAFLAPQHFFWPQMEVQQTRADWPGGTQKWLDCVLVFDSENILTVLCDETEPHPFMSLYPYRTSQVTWHTEGAGAARAARNGPSERATEVLPPTGGDGRLP